MLVLSRKLGETIKIGEGIEVTVIAVQGNRVRLGVAAPREVSVKRQELADEPVPAIAPEPTSSR